MVASKLEIQVRTDAVLSLNSAGSKLETQEKFLCYSLEENSFFRKPQSLFVRPLTN